MGKPFTFGNADIRFAEKKLVWRTYTPAKALPTTKRVELFSAKQFTTAALGANNKAFVSWSWKPRMFPSQSPPSTRITPMSSLRTLWYSYLSRLASMVIFLVACRLRYCSSAGRTVALDHTLIIKVLITWPSKTGIVAPNQGSTLLVAVVIPTGLLLPRVFRWIAAPLTSMLKTTGSSNLASRELEIDEVIGGGSRADETVVDLSKSSKSRRIVKKSKNLKGLKSYKGHRFEGTWLPTSTSSFWSRSPTCLTKAWIQAFEKRLLADQRLSGSGGGGARGVSLRSTKESH